MASGEAREQYRKMKLAADLEAGKAMGTLAAKKSNLFLSGDFAKFANPVQKKDITHQQFGI